jgi:hypothetical protein
MTSSSPQLSVACNYCVWRGCPIPNPKSTPSLGFPLGKLVGVGDEFRIGAGAKFI